MFDFQSDKLTVTIMPELPKRLLSVDVFRALTMLLMIFVNDVDGVKNIPAWIKHVSADADALGFADTIFPAFLFIVGLSLPFAIKNRLDKGKSFLSVSYYILNRSLALIVMGFFHVNSENYSNAAYLIKPVWMLLVTTGFFLVWLDYPDKLNRYEYLFSGMGVLLLITMAVLFKGGDSSNPQGMKSHWWGILGIIGWAYLVCAGIFLLTKGRLFLISLVFFLFMLINAASHLDMMPFSLWLIGDASSVSLIMAGVLVSGIYANLVESGKATQLWIILPGFGFLMLLYGLLLRPHAGGISKIYSTPAWVGICTGISIISFVLFVYN